MLNYEKMTDKEKFDLEQRRSKVHEYLNYLQKAYEDARDEFDAKNCELGSHEYVVYIKATEKLNGAVDAIEYANIWKLAYHEYEINGKKRGFWNLTA